MRWLVVLEHAWRGGRAAVRRGRRWWTAAVALGLILGGLVAYEHLTAPDLPATLGSRPALADQPALATQPVPLSYPAGASRTPTASPRPSPKPSTSKHPTRLTGTPEQQVLTLVNQQRTAAGCRGLRADTRLAAAAGEHSQDMATHHYFSHTGLDGSTFVDRIAAAGYPAGQAGGENIAAGYRTATDVMSGWMHSPGHRANILNCSYRAVGIGLAHAADGTAYWTQDFGRA